MSSSCQIHSKSLWFSFSKSWPTSGPIFPKIHTYSKSTLHYTLFFLFMYFFSLVVLFISLYKTSLFTLNYYKYIIQNYQIEKVHTKVLAT